MRFIGRNLLTQIGSQLHQAFLENSYVAFGGKSIRSDGNLRQLYI